MEETSYVTSLFFGRRFAIHGRNIHLQASQKNKLTWFVYLVQDTACQLQYVGSTTDVCHRWSSTKTACLGRKLTNTGLYKHFHEGCPAHLANGDVRHLVWTLVDFIVTTEQLLKDAEHIGGVACRCNECQRLKDQEDKWICRLGTFHPPHGLNTRDEIKTRSRVNFSRLTQAGSWENLQHYVSEYHHKIYKTFTKQIFISTKPIKIYNTFTFTKLFIKLQLKII